MSAEFAYAKCKHAFLIRRFRPILGLRQSLTINSFDVVKRISAPDSARFSPCRLSEGCTSADTQIPISSAKYLASRLSNAGRVPSSTSSTMRLISEFSIEPEKYRTR